MPAKAKPVTEPSKPEDRPTPGEAPVRDTDSYFVKNYLWPTLMGLAFALFTALSTGVPTIFGDGLQPGDWAKLGGTLLAAGLGYLANIWSRYGGKLSSFASPPLEPGQVPPEQKA